MSLTAALGIASGVGGLASGLSGSSSANKLAKKQLELMEEQLKFAQQQYADWTRVFGPVQDNLSEFYTSLTPDYFAAQGLEAYQKEFQRQEQELNDFFTANEIDSGVQVDVLSKGNFQAARDKAKIRTEAPFRVAEAKQGFLQIGLPQKAQAVNQILNAGTNLANTYGNQAAIAAQSADAGFDAAVGGFSTAAEIFDRKKLTANAGETL
jgi:hypothetical protein